MKLKFTTKAFIVSNLVFVIFRTLQILFLTESATAFLLDRYVPLSIIGTVICFMLIGYTVANSSLSLRHPDHIGKTGLMGMIIGLITALLLLGSAIYEYSVNNSVSLALLSFLSAIACVIFSLSEIKPIHFPKAAALIFIATWVLKLIFAYTTYTNHPLRARTVYEILALTLIIFFFICFGKSHSNVAASKNFKLLYPLGLATSTMCFASVVPEAIVTIIDMVFKTPWLIRKEVEFASQITPSSTSPLAILSAGILITYITLASYKRSNTHR